VIKLPIIDSICFSPTFSFHPPYNNTNSFRLAVSKPRWNQEQYYYYLYCAIGFSSIADAFQALISAFSCRDYRRPSWVLAREAVPALREFYFVAINWILPELKS
jgi:hypothetical protein